MRKTKIEFPKHLFKIRSIMPELLDILEKDREDNWYAFVWLEEPKMFSDLTIGYF